MKIKELKNINGIQKVLWKDVRLIIKNHHPKLVEIIDELNPGADLPLYIANYSYGQVIGDTSKFYYPNNQSSGIKTAELDSAFEYAGKSSPLSMILNNCAELYIEYNNDSIPCHLYEPGRIMSLPRELDEPGKSFHPAGLMNMRAGCRSVFSLQSLGKEVKHDSLRANYGVSYPAVKEMNEHWKLFEDIANFSNDSSWYCSILMFSNGWIKNIRNSPSWASLRKFLYQYAWDQTAYLRNKEYFDYLISMSLLNINRKPDPYIKDTVHHMLAIIGGAYPGFAPATDESQAPISKIQNALVNHFGVDYIPTIMQLSYYRDDSVYYSLNKPTLFKGRKTTTIKDLRELKYLTDEVLKNLGGENSPCKNTEVYNILTDTNFDYYHYKPGKFGEIQSSELIREVDSRFSFTYAETKKGLSVASAGQFLRGCIRFSKKSKVK